ncbi:MAG: NFACT family protein [Acutalibacteraceae bacterium]
MSLLALDGATLRILKHELESALGARIEKITMPYKDRLILSLSAKGFSKKLLISCSPSSPRINFTEEKSENPPVPPMICMLLRKRLTSAKLRDVRQAGIDRVLMLDFDSKNELADDITLTLIIEIMGRQSNILLVQEGKIIECVRRVDPEQGKRFLLPGAAYVLPPAQDRINIIDGDFDAALDRLIGRLKATALPLDRALGSLLDGISPIISREVAHLTLADPQKPADTLNAYEYVKLRTVLQSVRDAVTQGAEPRIIYDGNGVPKDFTFIPITQYGSRYTSKVCTDVSAAIDAFYSERDQAELLRRRSADMLKLLENLSGRIERKIHNRKRELEATKEREKFRIYGELVKANIHSIRTGDSYADCVNYYDEECKNIRIPLNAALSPQKNAAEYFNEYRKLSTAAGMLDRLIAAAEEEQKYIESVFDALCRANTAAEIALIREELVDAGYVKPPKGKRMKLQKCPPDRYLSSDGFEILVGKNNRQNDELTLKIAEKSDIWLHTKDIPGSHVIIRKEGRDIPERTYIEAAHLAAKHSKAASSRAVPVDYTSAKYVKKPSGAKPGMVIYSTNKTIFADPSNSEAFRGIRKVD